jgi:hypothetical protein
MPRLVSNASLAVEIEILRFIVDVFRVLHVAWADLIGQPKFSLQTVLLISVCGQVTSHVVDDGGEMKREGRECCWVLAGQVESR